MTPAAVQAFSKAYKAKFGRDPNFLGEMGYSAAQMVLLALDRAGRDLTVDSFIKGLESIDGYVDIFGNPPARLSATNHHASTESFLAVVKGNRWVAALPEPLGY
jgi:branched-chain amino acid transport system substrate-binding protein